MIDREIFRSLSKLVIFVGVAKVAGFLREASIAGYFGVSEQTDFFYYLLNLSMLPAALWLSLLNAYLVPNVLRLKEEHRAFFLSRMSTVSIGFAGLAFISITALLLLLAYLDITPGGWELFTAKRTSLAALLALIPIGCFIAYMSSVMLANGWHANTLFESLPALIVVGVLFAFAPPSLGVLCMAYLLGVCVQAGALGWILHKKNILYLPTSKRAGGPGFGIRDAVIVLAFSQFVMTMATLADQFFAVHYESGLLAEMTFANKITALIIGLSSLAISRALLPVFGRLVLSDWSLCFKTAVKWSAGLVVASSVFVAVVSYFSEPIVKLVFERGQFDRSTTLSVTQLFSVSLIQVPFYVGGIVLVSLLTSLKMYKNLLITSIVALVTKLLFNSLLWATFGRVTLVLSWTAVYAINFVLAFVFLYRHDMTEKVAK